MEKIEKKIALLIDAENAQSKLMPEILEESSKYGRVTIKRIYGDWTDNNMKGWKEVLNTTSITPVQKFAYTKGKNAIDIALIIEAMDFLHTKEIDGFCLVSSDSDFTGLANRIRESGLFVYGIGQRKTPASFINSCDIFTFTENLTNATEPLNNEAKLNIGLIRKAFANVRFPLLGLL